MARSPLTFARGTNAQVAAYTGLLGEPIVNTDTKALHLQDGVTAGGRRLLSEIDLADQVVSLTTYGLNAAGLAAALAAAPAVRIPKGAVPIASHTTIPNGKTLIVDPGADIQIASSVELTFADQSELIAPRRKIFSGSGTVIGLPVACPEWWGAEQSQTTSSSAAFQAAIESLRQNGILSLSAGTYALDGTTPLEIENGARIVGAGMFSTIIRILTTTVNFVAFMDVRGGGVQDLRVERVGSSPTAGTLIAFEGPGADLPQLRNLSFDGAWDVLVLAGGADFEERLLGGTIENVVGANIRHRGLFLNWVADVSLRGVKLDARPGHPSEAMIELKNSCRNVKAQDCTFSGGYGPSLRIGNDGNAISRNGDARYCTFTHCTFDDASVGADIQVATQIDFTDCSFSSNGRTIAHPGLTPGDGVVLGAAARNIAFRGGRASDNGQRAFLLKGSCRDIWIAGMEIAGNNVQNGEFWTIDVEPDVTDFSVEGNRIAGNAYQWGAALTNAYVAPPGAVRVQEGASDRYRVKDNAIIGLAEPCLDGGTGTNKDLSGSFIRRVERNELYADSPNQNIEALPGWTRIGGVPGAGVLSSGVARSAGTGTSLYVRERLYSLGHFIHGKLKATGVSGNYILVARAIDATHCVAVHYDGSKWTLVKRNGASNVPMGTYTAAIPPLDTQVRLEVTRDGWVTFKIGGATRIGPAPLEEPALAVQAADRVGFRTSTTEMDIIDEITYGILHD